MRVRSLLVALAVLAGLLGVVPVNAAPKPVEITMSNFRYCQKKVCDYTDQAYMADPRDGSPVGGQFNPQAKFPKVKPGQTVIWVYRDKGTPTSCDNYSREPANCEGHAVRLAKAAKRIGLAPARKGETKIVWTVPANAKPGTRIAYYCELMLHSQPFGMTGALDVVK